MDGGRSWAAVGSVSLELLELSEESCVVFVRSCETESGSIELAPQHSHRADNQQHKGMKKMIEGETRK